MKKIGKITLFHNSVNYGGVLQAFALNHFFEQSGYEVYEIDYTPTKQSSSEKNMFLYMMKTRTLTEMFQKLVTGSLKKFYAKIHKKEIQQSLDERKKAFQDFKDVNFQRVIACDEKTIVEKCKELDILICGSDQIWKPTVVNDAYMLDFSSDKCQRKFSYAASLSVDEINTADQEKYKAWLEKLDGVSVREEQAVSLLQPLTDKKVHWVCDPVFLFDKEEWMELSENKYNFEPYIFCYFLGADKKHRELACKYAEQNDLKIVTFPNLLQQPRKVDCKFGDYQIYDASPLDFMELIGKASYVLTDSFHATAFSILLHTPFAVVERTAVYSMNSRITSLLKSIGLEERMIKDSQQLMRLSNQIEWETVTEKVKDQKKKSVVYIESQMGGWNEG